MAAKAVEFTVTYTSKCPECAKTGNPDVSLGFSFEAGGIVCQTGGHKFAAVPGSEAAAGTKAVTRPAEAPKLATDGPFAARPKAEPETRETPAPARLPAVEIRQSVRVLDPQDLTNGDVEVKLRIPEQHAQALKAEAEVQHQTLEEYLQSWIEASLTNFWGR